MTAMDHSTKRTASAVLFLQAVVLVAAVGLPTPLLAQTRDLPVHRRTVAAELRCAGGLPTLISTPLMMAGMLQNRLTRLRPKVAS